MALFDGEIQEKQGLELLNKAVYESRCVPRQTLQRKKLK
jgi:hypothetical protein